MTDLRLVPQGDQDTSLLSRRCEGCGRHWRVSASLTRSVLLKCPYTDCRCSFLLHEQLGALHIERARSFYRRRTRSLREEFFRESREALSDHLTPALAVSSVLSILSVAFWVSPLYAFFLTLAAFPLLFWVGRPIPRALTYAYVTAILLIASALTHSPIELLYALPSLTIHLTSCALLIGASGLIGVALYKSLCLFSAQTYAAQKLQQEKIRFARLDAHASPAIPYR